MDATGIAVGETQAGKGALPDPHPLSLGGIGATGTQAANLLARDADLVLVVGSRLSDFTTASKTAFQHEQVRFIGINVTELDAFKHAALPLVGDARAVLDELLPLARRLPSEPRVHRDGRRFAGRLASRSRPRVSQSASPPVPHRVQQAQVIGVLQETLAPADVIVCAAGSLPGDLHKLWRARDPKGYHMEYGYSCMGYEIAGGLGVKMAAPDRDVYVLVGDGSYLMMAQEIVTAVQEGIKITIVLLDNHGFASIGGLSEAVGSGGFGTRYRYRNAATGELDGEVLPVDLAANAASLGAHVDPRRHARRLPRCARRGREGDAHVGHRRARRSRGARRRLRLVVGRAGRRGLDDPRGPGRARGVGNCAATGARLPVIRVANAPCSWGVLEFEAPAAHAPAAQVLDEMAAAGYAGTELGDWGFLPTDPAVLAADVQRRALALVGAFVPIALAREDALDEGLERAVRTARLLAASTRKRGHDAAKGPYLSAVIVLSDDNTAVPNRTARAGRIREEDGLSADAVGRVRGACRARGGSGPRRDRPPDRLPPSLRRLRRDAAGRSRR